MVLPTSCDIQELMGEFKNDLEKYFRSSGYGEKVLPRPPYLGYT